MLTEELVTQSRSANHPATHNGHGTVREGQAPLENYAARQKSVNFFSNLMDRWRQ
jgi:hypothetical protein